MTKLSVSLPTYNELKVLLTQQGKEINDGAPLQIEKGTALMPPHDFRMVAIRQNCLMAASEVFKNSAKDTSEEFLDIANHIFNWCMDGKKDTTEANKGWK